MTVQTDPAKVSGGDGASRKVFFIAVEFPPMNTAGVFRSLKFIKYLSQHGITPVVITIETAAIAAAFRAPLDEELLADVPASIDIIRLPLINGDHLYASRWRSFKTIYFSIEDSLGARWASFFEDRLPALLKQHKPVAVYVSLPPFSSGRIAARAAKQAGLPLIVDMRDGWSHWTIGPFGSFLHFWLTLRRERALFRAAAAVVTVTRQLADVFARSHPELPREKLFVVPNGYDFELELPTELQGEPLREGRQFIVGYLGNFYYTPEARAAHFTPWWRKKGHRKWQYAPVREDWLYRSPYFFLRALARVFAERPALRDRVRFKVLGCDAPWLYRMAEEQGLAGNCEFEARRPYEAVQQFLKGTDALLCTGVKVPNGEDYALASKTFDYLRVAKPLLGFVKEGAQRDFLQRSGMALICDPDDEPTCVTALEALIDGRFSLRVDRTFLGSYHRRATARSLATIIEGVTSRRA